MRGADFADAVIAIGPDSRWSILGDELRALRRLKREQDPASERGAPFTTAGFARMVERAAHGL